MSKLYLRATHSEGLEAAPHDTKGYLFFDRQHRISVYRMHCGPALETPGGMSDIDGRVKMLFQDRRSDIIVAPYYKTECIAPLSELMLRSTRIDHPLFEVVIFYGAAPCTFSWSEDKRRYVKLADQLRVMKEPPAEKDIKMLAGLEEYIDASINPQGKLLGSFRFVQKW